MYFSVRRASPTNRGLRVIETVPDVPFAQLEGRNGIGKSLFIRLLQLATDSQPYASMPRAWQTLKAGLGQCEISIAGLKAGREVSLMLEPDQWPDRPEPRGDWIGTARIDGEASDWKDVSDLVRVFRVGGDESLGRSLAAQVRADREIVEQRREQLLATANVWTGHLQELQEVVAPAVSSDWHELAEEVKHAQASLKEWRDRRKRLADRRADLVVAAEIVEGLIRIRSEEPGLLARAEELHLLSNELHERIGQLDESISALLVSRGAPDQLQGELRRTERLYGLRRERLRNREHEVAVAMRQLGLPEMTAPDAYDAARVNAAVAEFRAELRLLEEQRTSVDTDGLIVEIIDDVDPRLSSAEARGLGSAVVAAFDDIEVSVSEMRSGLERRRSSISERPSADASETLEKIRVLNSRMGAARAVHYAMRMHGNAVRDFREVTGALRNLVAEVGGANDGEVATLQEEKSEVLDKLTAASIELGEVNTRLEELRRGGTAEELVARLESIGPSESLESITSELEEVNQNLLEAGHEVGFAEQDAGEARRTLQVVEGALLQSVRRLHSTEMAWAAAIVGDLPEATDRLALQQRLQRFSASVRELFDRVVGVETDILALSAAMDVLSTRLASESTSDDLPRLRFMESLADWYEQRVARQLGAPELREVLFDNGTDVSLSMRTLITSWTDETGSLHSRPLEAYSSGEHAFAYTRFQLEQVAASSAENRAVFLDEFGAYVAHDRLSVLMSYVRSRVLGELADQIVLVLPLGAPPSGAAEASDVADHGYFVRPL